RQLPRDRAGGPLGTGPPRPQGRPDFRVRFRRREDDPGARRGGRRWIRRRHEPEQCADDRLRDGHRGGRGQAGGQAGQVRRPQGSAALSEGRDLRGRGADVCSVRLEGRHARPLALTGQSVVGIDVSRKLLTIGKKATSSSQDFRSIEWVGADATALPFPDATFDAALCIAVLHHLASRVDRLLAVTEMRRVLRPGAKAFLSVWSLDDPYLERVLGGRPKKPDVEIPWRLPDGTTVPRPYHL